MIDKARDAAAGTGRTRPDPARIEVVDDEMARVLRQKTPAERLGIAFSLWESSKKMLTAHLAHSHPDWTAEQVQREVARRMSHGAVDEIPNMDGSGKGPTHGR